ncbi:MAG TPA: hypothetical protein VFH31_17275 [Pyrinomonadaceae bacterium]|nr:hypothetical protein [Pyrinomonadaceae bacterium]
MTRDDRARKALKQKVIERWENEGGKVIDTNVPRVHTEEDKSEGRQSARSSKNLRVGTKASNQKETSRASLVGKANHGRTGSS